MSSRGGFEPPFVADETLVQEQLRKRAENGQLLIGSDDESFKGSSYDFRAGEEVIIADPESEDHCYRDLERQESISIKPGSAVTFRSFEQLDLPDNIKGRLSPKSRLANKKVFYPGGLIDPGYTGYIWFTFFNIGTKSYEISYKDEIVTGEFIQIKPTIEYNNGEKINKLPEKMLPRVPSVGESYTFDWDDVNKRLKKDRNK